ncbi:hypothetical protein [Streptomyces sp. F001]|uniref:ATP-binding protein n=1 Tax=Streptomyces sp. F001 TaxID=1510026 RepID=UPI0023EA553E|nr:hypothetical protein [Streptomyces sp. F001]
MRAVFDADELPWPTSAAGPRRSEPSATARCTSSSCCPARSTSRSSHRDGTGAVTHLWERECTVQRRHQKLIEIAPSPWLPAGTRMR